MLLGLATAVKIQVGGAFLLYYVLLGRWRAAIPAALIFGMISLIGILPLERRGIFWSREWKHNVAQTLEPGQGNDPRPAPPSAMT